VCTKGNSTWSVLPGTIRNVRIDIGAAATDTSCFCDSGHTYTCRAGMCSAGMCGYTEDSEFALDPNPASTCTHRTCNASKGYGEELAECDALPPLKAWLPLDQDYLDHSGNGLNVSTDGTPILSPLGVNMTSGHVHIPASVHAWTSQNYTITARVTLLSTPSIYQSLFSLWEPPDTVFMMSVEPGFGNIYGMCPIKQELRLDIGVERAVAFVTVRECWSQLPTASPNFHRKSSLDYSSVYYCAIRSFRARCTLYMCLSSD
jgi:hypothetical protein